jgi:hypothetical protein
MKFVHTLLALAMTAAAGSAIAAGPGHLGNLSGNSFAIGNSFSGGAAIFDTYTFDILPLASVAGTAVSIELDIPMLPGQEFAIGDFTIAFYDAANILLASDTQSGPGDTMLDIDSLMLGAGMGYKFVVTGNVTGTLGGSYGGALAAAPVPEARTYALMLAGLGLIGFVVSRRRIP